MRCIKTKERRNRRTASVDSVAPRERREESLLSSQRFPREFYTLVFTRIFSTFGLNCFLNCLVIKVLNRSNNPMDSRLNQLNSTFHAPYPMLTGVGSSSDTGSGQVNGSQHQAPVPAAGIVPHQALAPQLPPLLPQPLMTSGSRKDCIRLRGLPYEAQVEQILEFLLDSAKNIVFQGVHMVYNSQVRKSFLN